VSTNRNANKEDIQVVAIILALIFGAFLLAAMKLSRSTGADLEVSMIFLLKGTLASLIAIAFWYLKYPKPNVMLLTIFWAIPVWISWWSVINNINAKAQVSNDMLLPTLSLFWWTTDWAKYGIPIALVVVLFFFWAIRER
jgi:hypothetical protein